MMLAKWDYGSAFGGVDTVWGPFDDNRVVRELFVVILIVLDVVEHALLEIGVGRVDLLLDEYPIWILGHKTVDSLSPYSSRARRYRCAQQ